MIKKDFIAKISYQTGLNDGLVRLIIERFLKEIRESLLRREKIEIRSFGVFYIKKFKAKKGRNMKTGEIVNIPERQKIVFKPSKIFNKEK
ncbi:MAG: integration host factor subunit beta [Candidatus Omnitrophica bacterium]|jgi:DNA-binding protein HU-beta|nr:integration host factor subunit beta [Candidatus Omnitrophota bacterium]